MDFVNQEEVGELCQGRVEGGGGGGGCNGRIFELVKRHTCAVLRGWFSSWLCTTAMCLGPRCILSAITKRGAGLKHPA